MLEGQKLEDDAKQEAEEQLRRILDLSQEGLVRIDAQDCIIFVNARFAQMVGRTVSDLIGCSIFDLVYPEEVPQARAARASRRHGAPVQYELRMPRKDGTECWVIVRVSAVFENGVYAGTLSLLTEITDRKLAEDALRQSEARLAEAQRVARVGSWDFDIATGKVNWSEEMFILIGRDPGEGAPDYPTNLALYHPEDAAKLDTRVTCAIEQGQDYALDLRRAGPDGAVQWYHAVGHAVVDQFGQTVRLTGTLLDITDRKRTEETLRRREEDLQFAIGAAGLGTFCCEWPSERIVLNEIGQRHLAVPPEADVDFPLFYSRLHPEDREPTRAALEKALATREEYNVEYRVLTGEKQMRWINAVGHGTYHSDGSLLRFDGITMDISERRSAQQEITAAAARDALINTIGNSLRHVQTPEAILRTAVESLGRALNADRCCYVTDDPARQQVTLGPDWHRAGLCPLAGEYPRSGFDFDHAPNSLAGSTHIVTDSWELPYPGPARRLGLRSLLRVSLTSYPAMTALVVAMSEEVRDWTTHEIRLAEAVAGQTQAALETARFQQKQQRIAEALQEALLPEIPKDVPGLAVAAYMKPALEEAAIGGDFCDIFLLEPTQYAVVLGDVSGKGLAAAAQLAAVRNMLRVCLYQHPIAAEAISRLNAVVTGHGLLDGFVTLFAGIYDVRSGKISYVSCGHEPVLHCAAADKQITAFEATGPPLGVDQDAVFTEGCFTLITGDSLFLYTDGLAEAGPTRTTMLGTDGMIRLMQAHAGEPDVQTAADRIVTAAQAHAAGVFRDDVCAVFLRRL